MNLKSGVRVMVTESGVTGNIRSVLGEGDEAQVIVAPSEGGEDLICAVSGIKTLKGRPRKMA